MAPRCGCGTSSSCNCRVIAGDNVTVTGTGSSGNPYVVSSTGGGGGSCAYTPEMTRAAALALRTGGDLVIGCPVVITDGPTIGTPGLTSPTTIQIWPVSATEFGMEAQINTTFDDPSGSGWRGLYDIEGGSGGTGAIVALQDNRGNDVIDRSGLLIELDFPWGYTNVTGNRLISTSTGSVSLNAWGPAAAAGCQIVANEIIEGDDPASPTFVDLVGLIGPQTNVFTGNRIESGGAFRIVGDTPAEARFTANIVRDGFILNCVAVNVPEEEGLATLQIDGCTFYGHYVANAGGDLNILTDGSIVILDDVIVESGLNAATPITLGGTGTAIFITSSEFGGGSLNFSRADDIQLAMSGVTIMGGTYTFGGTGPGIVGITNSQLVGNNIFTRDAAATGDFTITGSRIASASLIQSASAESGLEVVDSLVNGGTINQIGEGQLRLENCTANGGVLTNSGGAIRGLVIADSFLNDHVIQQTRSLDAFADSVQTCVINGTLVLSGAAGTAGDYVTVVGCRISEGSSVSIADPVGGSTMLTSAIEGNSSLVLSAGGTVSSCRFACGAAVTTGAFNHDSTIVEGAFTTTFTGANSNRLKNKGFSDTV